jgi:hypothetical protein
MALHHNLKGVISQLDASAENETLKIVGGEYSLSRRHVVKAPYFSGS